MSTQHTMVLYLVNPKWYHCLSTHKGIIRLYSTLSLIFILKLCNMYWVFPNAYIWDMHSMLLHKFHIKICRIPYLAFEIIICDQWSSAVQTWQTIFYWPVPGCYYENITGHPHEWNKISHIDWSRRKVLYTGYYLQCKMFASFSIQAYLYCNHFTILDFFDTFQCKINICCC